MMKRDDFPVLDDNHDHLERIENVSTAWSASHGRSPENSFEIVPFPRSSTPVPPGTPLEERNYIDTPRPFKNPNYIKSANRRMKSLKQILAAEREAALGLDSTASGKRKGKKSAFSALNGNGTTTSTAQASRAGTEDIPDGDVTMGSIGGDLTTEDVSKELEAAAAAAAAQAKRKRELPNFTSVEAPPSLRPRKKFCDITGLLAPYTDPKTNLRYHSVELYEIIKTFGPGVDQAYLNLRGESSQIK